MKKVYINYADKGFQHSQALACESAKKFNFDIIKPYTISNVDTEFLNKNKRIFDLGRGAGYWLWKFYIIVDSLNKMSDGDILFYCDSGKELMHDITPLIDILHCSKQPIMPYEQLVQEKVWTKRDLFIYNNCDTPEYTDSNHYDSSTHLIIKNKETLEFYNTCLEQGCTGDLITDGPNIYGQSDYPEFKEHRHDQSIYSIQVKL